MLKALEEEEKMQFMQTVLIVKATLLDRYSQDEVDSFNKLFESVMNYYFAEEKQKKEDDKASMESIFNRVFKKDGKPKSMSIDVGEPMSQDQNFETKLGKK